MEPWLQSAADRVRSRGLDPSCLALLEAFHTPGTEETRALEVLEARVDADVDDLVARIPVALATEVDPGQAAMFARRVAAVAELLATLGSPEAQLLVVGLAVRGRGILEGDGPRALRVRAIADFYWSRAAVLQHRRPGAPAPEDLARSVSWRSVAPGVDHALITGITSSGPLHANALRVREGRFEALDARGARSLVDLVRTRGATAGTSGGFFLYSEPNIAPPSYRTDPVGLIVDRGEVVGPPVFRRSALVHDHEGFHIRRIGPSDASLEVGGREFDLWDPRFILYNRAGASRGSGVSIVGSRVVEVGPDIPVPLNGIVVHGMVARPGDEVGWRLRRPARAAMAGGPLLLRDGRVEVDLDAEQFTGDAPPMTFSNDETFDQNLLPRLACGLDPEGVLTVVAVDGRNFERAPGLTLRGTARLLRGLGCTRAMNLDGGSSKRMVVGERVVDLPSTEVVGGDRRDSGSGQEVRPVHSALLFFPRASGATGSR